MAMRMPGRQAPADVNCATAPHQPGRRSRYDLQNVAHAQASPAIVDGVIFLRTDTHLYRIEKL